MGIIRRLYQFVWLNPTSFVWGSLVMALGFGLGNIAPLFVKWLTQAVQAGQMDQAVNLVLSFGLVLLVANLLENLGYFITDKNMVTTSTLIAQKVLTHIHNLDFAYHTNKSSGKLISLMKRGDDAFFSYYDTFNRQFLNIFLSFGVMIGAFTQLKPEYILFVIGLIGLSVAVSVGLVKINIKKRNVFNKADDELSSARADNLVNFDTVKYFANEVFEQSRFQSLLAKWNRALQDYFFTFRYFDVILGNIINLSLVGIMAWGVFDLKRGTLSLADFLMITTFAMTLFPKMMHFLFNLRELAKRYSDLKRYLNLLDEEVTVAEPTNPVSIPGQGGQIVFDKVTFHYEKRQIKVLTNFSLKIKNGEVVALVGYSGAGKSTIAKLLMRMYDPQQGMIMVNGVDIKQVKKSDLRSKVGIVPQDPLLFNNTVEYNIAYADQKASKEDIDFVAESAKIDGFIKDLPNGYQTMVGERGIKLSGGQRQRLAIARVLLKQPDIIIFDEATSALDSASEQKIQSSFWDLVRDKKHPRTAIVIAHRLSTIMRADRIVVMDKGEIVDIGSHQELVNKKTGIYHQLWSLQKGGFIGDGETNL